MSEKMTEDMATESWRMALDEGLSGPEAEDLRDDHLRARRVEVEQAETLRQKDATIKALADALQNASAALGRLGVSRGVGAEIRKVALGIKGPIDAALRLAGR
jgi:hypothetical protein